MKVLVIGSGGREHAIAWRLARSKSVKKVLCTPGNPGCARVAECLPGSTVDDYARLAEERNVDLVVVGPEAPLVGGIADRLRASGRPVVGPTAAAAQLEGSKVFAKELMVRADVPTANYVTLFDMSRAPAALENFTYPLVLKADGLAAGKGVVVVHDREEALAAMPGLLALNGKLLIEEHLAGTEVSFMVLSDGIRVLPLAATQDHKTAFDGDKGPNTGGMGAYCSSGILTVKQTTDIMSKIVDPVVARMAQEGNPFTGFLYAGLMMTEAGPQTLEFNVRLGDPEAQALLHRMNTDFGELLMAAALGDLSEAAVDWSPDPSVCVVMASRGYPGNVCSEEEIHGIEEAERTGAVVFQAGTKQTSRGLVAAGGRVLGVTASGADLATAIGNTYEAVSQIHFEGMHYRTDIGAKGLRIT